MRLVPLASADGANALVPYQLQERLAQLERVRQAGEGGSRWRRCPDTDAWVLLPELGQTPWAVVHFVGGAGFGSEPQLSYDQLLRRLVAACGGGVVVVATPFEVGLNHGELASAVAATFDRCRVAWQERQAWPELRTFRVGHSLGAKLLLLNRCTTGSHEDGPLGLVAFNNFGFSASLDLGLRFFERLAGPSAVPPIVKNVVQAASLAMSGAGLEFDPSPSTTEALAAGQSDLASGMVFFRFSDDDLDSSQELQARLQRPAPVKDLTGEHLSPIVLRLSAADLVDTADADVARDLFAALQDSGLNPPPDSVSFSFGEEAQLDALVDALAEWMGVPAAPNGPARALPPFVDADVVDEGG